MPTIVRAFDEEGGADHAVRDLDAANIDLNNVYRINNEGRATGWIPTPLNSGATGPDDAQRTVSAAQQQPGNPIPVPTAPAPAVAGTGGALAGSAAGGIVGGPAGSTAGSAPGAWGLLTLSSADAGYYANHVNAGHVIVAVNASDDQVDRVSSILNRNGGHEMMR